jgi:sterol desaturase/sphingolipid hydroxylase (fatty acid hydroxylase superfamily)
VNNVLRDEARAFWSFAGPRLIGAAFALVVTVRLVLGDWSAGDLVVAAVILGLEPLTEWLIHVCLLHFRPRTIGGRRLDLYIARKHRAHHADPKDQVLVLVPIRVVVPALLVAGTAMPLLFPTVRLGVTGVVVSFGMLLTYEWTHHLIHSAYRPKGRYYRYIWRAHRLHHFRNEHYWYGVTIHLADHLLRTFPDKDAVPVSPTARTLGVEAA